VILPLRRPWGFAASAASWPNWLSPRTALAARPRGNGFRLRRAEPADAAVLARLNQALAEHIAASPILFPKPQGMPSAEWATWLEDGRRVVLLAEADRQILGYIKAEEAQIDVSW
jgi:hypothetical protein